MESKNEKWKMLKLIFLIIILVATIIACVYFLIESIKSDNPQEKNVNKNNKTKIEKKSTWEGEQLAVQGAYADPEVVKLPDGTYRMYYGVEPEQKNRLEVYASNSVDGKTWTQDPRNYGTKYGFIDILKLADGSYRMYYYHTSERVIKSALSTDGLNWTDEPGIRLDNIDSDNLGFENIAAPTVIQLDDGTFVMVYRVSVPQKYAEFVPNDRTTLLLWATSNDGLNWSKKGIAVDTRRALLEGHADGPEWRKTEDGKNMLYFWGYKGVYESEFSNGQFLEPDLVYGGESSDKLVAYRPDPPSDPSLIKIKDQWFMYYGHHTKGIYYTTLK